MINVLYITFVYHSMMFCLLSSCVSRWWNERFLVVCMVSPLWRERNV